MMKKIALVLFFAISIANAHAQKLPKVQTVPVRAPQNIKIDGNITEWNDKFQAYNFGNHIYYTLSNDDTNLYLTARMDDMLGTRKVFKGGITFSILPRSKKAESISISYPVPDRIVMGPDVSGGEPTRTYSFIMKEETNSIAKNKRIDSLITSANKEMGKIYKYIYVTGINGISDSLISIYNNRDIAIGARFDKSMNYTYELAIPLKYLGAALSDNKKFKYNILISPLSPLTRTRKPTGPTGPELQVATRLAPELMDDVFIYNDSDFSGEYTLAK